MSHTRASFKMTANDVPAIRGTSRILVDVFMRKYRMKFDVKECRGQPAVECGDEPPGGLSTLRAHQMAHGGNISHPSSSELSAHQMPARLTSARIAKTTPPIWGKVRERTSAKPHDVAAAPPLDHCLRRYSRVHLRRRQRCGDGETRSGKAECEATWCGWRTSPNLPGKGECEDTRCVCRTSPGSLPSLQQGCRGPQIVGPDAKATGPRPARHLSGPDGAQHDASADPRYAWKNKRRARDITHLTTVHVMNQRGGWCGVHG